MPKLNQNATIYKGSSVVIQVTVLDEDEQPVNLTGQTLFYRISKVAQSATLLEVSTPDITIGGPSSNVASIPLTIAQTEALPPGPLYHELYREDGATATSYMIGTLTAAESQMDPAT